MSTIPCPRVLARRLMTAGLALTLAACSSSTTPESATGGGPVVPGTPIARAKCKAPTPIAGFTPLPAARDRVISPEVRAARERILGAGWDDPAEAKLWWFGVSSFVASLGGHLFFFDAWEIVGLHADYVPIGREELAELAPEAMFFGHGHFDHAGDAGYVAGRSGAVVVGSEEICATAREQADSDGNGDAVRCLITGTASSPAPSAVPLVVAASPRMAPSVGPTHGVHATANAAPATTGPLPLARTASPWTIHWRFNLVTNGVAMKKAPMTIIAPPPSLLRSG